MIDPQTTPDAGDAAPEFEHVWQAVVLESLLDTGSEDDIIDEDTIGIYSDYWRAADGIERYRAHRFREEPQAMGLAEVGGEIRYDIREVIINRDIIYPETTP